ncbi:hypothetical protein [Bifidobacterium pseudolongum]|uniref:hypothetical protein n=1 Tax=Bifidobacterium pseudolongum TaxID=1694 RepID=UPI0039942A45
MGYAVVGYFDKATDEWIRRIWKELMINDIDDYLYNSENNPHIKFAMYDNLKEIDIINAIEDISQMREQIDIIFKSYSFYPNDQPFSTLTWPPVCHSWNYRLRSGEDATGPPRCCL